MQKIPYVAKHFAKCALFTITYSYIIADSYRVRLNNSKATKPPAISQIM